MEHQTVRQRQKIAHINKSASHQRIHYNMEADLNESSTLSAQIKPRLSPDQAGLARLWKLQCRYSATGQLCNSLGTYGPQEF